jgi:hypothetical protein
MLNDIEAITEDIVKSVRIAVLIDRRKLVFPTQRLVMGGRSDFVSFMYH